MAMELEIECYGCRDNESEYGVIVDGKIFETWVVSCPAKVEKWIRSIENWNNPRLHRLIVGLDVEWRPNTIPGEDNAVAILQLFVSRSCLIYQLHRAMEIPEDLRNFLKNPSYTFVGVGIENDKQKLYKDYSLEVAKTADLRERAAAELTDADLRSAGLKKLAKVILGKDVGNEELMEVRMSDWGSNPLSNAQVLYACLDAYLSFEIGRQLEAWYD